MAKKFDRKPASETCIRVWRGDRHTAATTPISDLKNLQKRFRDRLTISRERDGGLMIYSDSPGDHRDFHVFMAKHTPFTSQVIGTKHL